MESGCTEHLFIPDLIPFAEPVTGDVHHIVYVMMSDGRKFANVAGQCFPVPECPCFASSELAAIAPEAIGNDKVEMARSILGGRVVEK